MDTAFDFRISQPACVEALETYRRVETILADEREKQKQTIETLKPNWAGYSAETFAVEMGQFLDNGEYNHTYDKVKGIRQLLEEVLPEVNTLLARCEGFAEQLENDEYIEPMRPMAEDNTIRNGGILSLNYGMINVIVNLCYEIEEENRVLTNTLKDIAYQCGGLIGNTESNISAIEAASRKINRIANFRESFQRYAMGVRNLEYEMNLQLCRLAEDTCGLGEKVGISQTELESGEMDKADIYDLSFMSDVELTALMEKCIEDDDIETMKCVAGQIFAQDSIQWSEAEAMFIAQTMNHAFEKGELEIIELYTNNLLVGTYTAPNMQSISTISLTTVYGSKYVVKPDVEKIELIMGSLNAKEQGLTYYTLNRLANMEMNVVIESTSSEEIDCGTYHVEAQKVFGEIQLIIQASVPGDYVPINEYADKEFSMTAYDMGEILTIEKAKELVEAGYSLGQIEALRECVVTDADVNKLCEWISEGTINKYSSLTPDDIGKVFASLKNENVYLSDERSDLFYQGEIYEIYVPNYCSDEVKFESPEPWNEVAKLESNSREFDLAAAIAGYSFEDIDRIDDSSKRLGANDTEFWGQGQGFLLGVGVLQSINDATDMNTVTVHLIERNGEGRAIISVNNKQKSMALSDVADGLEHSKIDEALSQSGSAFGNVVAQRYTSDYCQSVYLLATEKNTEDWDEKGIYDIVYTLDERHKNSSCIGYISYKDDNMIYTPLVYSGDTLKIGTRKDFSIFHDTVVICDISDKLSQSSLLSEEYQKLLEGIIIQN